MSISSLTKADNSGAADTHFGKEGIAVINSSHLTTGNSSCMVATPDNKFLATWSANTPDNSTVMGIARLTNDGAMDRTFGVEGLVECAFKQGHRNVASGLALMPDTRTLLWGHFFINSVKPVPALICVKKDGAVDNTFGEQGVFAVPEPLENESYMFNSACVLPDNSIFMVYGKNLNGLWTTYITKLMPDGTLDERFAERGVREFQHHGQSTSPGGVLMLKNGHLVVFSSVLNNDVFIACFDSQGVLVPDFADQGVLTLAYDDKTYLQFSLVETPTGLVSIGSTILRTDPNISHGMMVGITFKGQLDTAFNQAKPVIITFPPISPLQCHQIVCQPDAKLVIAGYRAASDPVPQGMIGRYLSDGTPDNSFGQKGLASTGTFVHTSSKQGMALSPKRRIVCAGRHDKHGVLAGFLG